MSIILDGLKYLAYILIFPGFLFCFLSGLLLCGIDRKLVARMQKRVGPPILQPFYDFFKLLGKETIVPVTANRTVFLIAPLVVQCLPRCGGRDRHSLPSLDPGSVRDPRRGLLRFSLFRCRPLA